jgi:hypothetical protein
MSDETNNVVSLFSNKIDELRKKYPSQQFYCVEMPIKVKKRGQSFKQYGLVIDEDLSFYFDYTPKELELLDSMITLIETVKTFNSIYKNLKVFPDDPNVVWCNYGTQRTPIFTSLANFGNETGRKKFKELNEKAEFVLKNKEYFICSHCHFLKKKAFMFSEFLNGNTCVACVEVDYDGSNY